MDKKPNGYWTKEKCKEIAIKFNTRIELKKFNPSVYTTALKNKWLDDICKHMTYINKRWNYKKCKIEANKYNNRTSFQKGSHGAYEHARINNFLEELCIHMKIKGNYYKRCIYVFEFEDNYAYIGLTYNINERKNDHLSKKKSQVYKHIKKTKSNYKFIQLTEYIDVYDAREKEEYFVKKYKDDGWIILNKSQTGGIGGSPLIWSHKKVKSEAIKYTYRNDFRKGAGGAYSYARNQKILDDVCKHMSIKPRSGSWSKEDEQFLLKNYQKGTKYCAEKLNRTRPSVKSRYKKLTT